MVVGRFHIGTVVAALVFAALSAVPASAQSFRAWVDKAEVTQNVQFWLFVEANGQKIQNITVPEISGLTINRENRLQASTQQLRRGVYRETLKISYPTWAIKTGKITIPPITAQIDGRKYESEPIQITAKPGPKANYNARAYVLNTEVSTDKQFWIYMEATGTSVTMPDRVALDSLEILDTARAMNYQLGKAHQEITRKLGLLVKAQRAGTIVVPEFEIKVSGRTVKTRPITLTVTAAPPPPEPPKTPQKQPETISSDELVLIDMFVDQNEVYQGEAILLTKQVWQFDERWVSSGPRRGGLLMDPTTQGFYARDLEPRTYVAKRNGWKYEVREQRKLLFPLDPGMATIGKWHVDYIALVNRASNILRKSYNYTYDQGPIPITVKPLPDPPADFSGAVGDFTMSSIVPDSVLTQGVPLKLQIIIQGRGNADAVSSPEISSVNWAHVSQPDRYTEPVSAGTGDGLDFTKRNVYTITPTKAGAGELPEVHFTYFSPSREEYVTEKAGPFHFNVMASAEEGQHVTVAEDFNRGEEVVDVLAVDIHSVISRPGSLKPAGISPSVTALALGVPPLLYFAFSLVMVRRKRFQTDMQFARAHRARSHGVKRLRNVYEEEHPDEVLYQTMTHFIADKLGIDQGGLTSRDVDEQLRARGVSADTVDAVVRILRACERARYADQALSTSEVNAMLAGAESCMGDLEREFKGGKR